VPIPGRAGPNMNNNRGIIGIIEDEVKLRGAVSFARFMELALYCPNFGYYERTEASPGRNGDYFTSVSVGPLFGELLANRFAGWLVAVPDGKRQILEAGAHDGQLALDMLRRLKTHWPDVLDSLEYWILEPSIRRRQSQEITLSDFQSRVRWFESWDALPPDGVRGVIFSNELLDAMPVHRLGWDAVGGKWFEWGVALEDGRFVWTKLNMIDPSVPVPVLPNELLAVLPDGFSTEVCPAATNWWHRAAQTLRDGKLLAFDYGLAAEEFFTPERKDGTLRAYYQHHATRDILERAGEQDITASVNFSAIRYAGESAGLVTETFATQAQFMADIVAALVNEPRFNEWFAPRSRQFQTLTHPEHLGQSFRVLVQGR
jgi:SAM-dependent MidA family methyltransferase